MAKSKKPKSKISTPKNNYAIRIPNYLCDSEALKAMTYMFNVQVIIEPDDLNETFAETTRKLHAALQYSTVLEALSEAVQGSVELHLLFRMAMATEAQA